LIQVLGFMRIWIAIFLAWLSLSSLKAQTGNYFLSHYTPSDERIDYITFSMAQNDHGVLYLANKAGVLEFDGRNWNLVPTPAPVYTVVTKGKDVFVGGFSGYGKLVWGPDNTEVYQSLSPTQSGAKQITSSIPFKDMVYFQSEEALYGVSLSSGQTETTIRAEPQSAFTGLFEIDGEIYVGSDKHGLRKIEHGKLVAGKFQMPGSLPLLFCSSLPGSNKVFLGTANNRIFLFDPHSGLREIKLKDEFFLESNVMVNGTWVNEKLLAIGTLRGGVLFVNPNTGVTEEISNYYTGLPDNEVYSILCDRNQGVWVANDFGLTRIAPYLPFRSYSHYAGLAGNLLCAHRFKGQIYVGTTLGLFTLVGQEVYIDEPYFYKIQPRVRVLSKEGLAKGVSGFLSLFKKDKNKSKPSESTKNSHALSGKTTRRVLKSIRYSYRKVEGVEGKVNQLTEADGKLLASGITGVLEVDGLKSKPITPEPVRTIILSTSLNQLLVSTLNNDIKSFRHESKVWKETHLFDTLQEDINYVFEDKLQNIWLCGKTIIYKIETADNQVTNIRRVHFSNGYMDEPVGISYGNEVYLAASGLNKYDDRQNKFVRVDSLLKKYFASEGYFWFYNGHRWRTVDQKMEESLKLKWLGLFQNIRFLAPVGQGEGLWVITGSNELYKFSSNKVATDAGGYPLFLREVRGQQNKIIPKQSVKVSQLEGTVALEFIQPDYLGMKAIEYRYKVNELSKIWSDYSTNNNVVPFPYLPTGKYKVEIQTRDLMGKESDVQQIELEVEPPYWRQSWFYASEFAFFTILVVLSLKLSSGNSKYQYISRLLSVLTVIMLIQFIQTVVSSQISIKSTPVIDFFIQVFIALLILPIEGLLRKFIIRSSEDQGKTAHLWDESGLKN